MLVVSALTHFPQATKTDDVGVVVMSVLGVSAVCPKR